MANSMKTTIKKKGMMEQNNNQTEQYASQERISKHLREIEDNTTSRYCMP